MLLVNDKASGISAGNLVLHKRLYSTGDIRIIRLCVIINGKDSHIRVESPSFLISLSLGEMMVYIVTITIWLKASYEYSIVYLECFSQILVEAAMIYNEITSINIKGAIGWQSGKYNTLII